MDKSEFDKILKTIVDKTQTTVSPSELSNYLFITSFVNGKFIVVPRNLAVDWLKLKQFVREKSILWSLNFTDEFIEEKMKELLSELKHDTVKLQNLGRTTKNWLDNLQKIQLVEHIFVRPIHYFNIKSEIDFGKVKIVKLSKRILDSVIPHSLRKNDQHYKNIITQLTSSNNTKIFAIVKVMSTDRTHGEKLSREYLERALNAIRIFYDIHPVVQGEDFVAIQHHSFIHIEKNRYGEQYSNLNLKIPKMLDSQIKKQFEPIWKILRPFLFSNSPTPLQSRLLVSLEWYGDAMKDKSPHSSFFKYVTSIETLLVLEKGEKAKKIAHRLSEIIYKNSPHKLDSYNQMKSYYETRNGVIHAGRTVVHKEDLAQLQSWSQWLIQKFIHESKKHHDIPTLLKNKYGL